VIAYVARFDTGDIVPGRACRSTSGWWSYRNSFPVAPHPHNPRSASPSYLHVALKPKILSLSNLVLLTMPDMLATRSWDLRSEGGDLECKGGTTHHAASGESTLLLGRSRDWRGDKVGIENACPSPAATAAVGLSDRKATTSSHRLMQPVSQRRLPTTHPSHPRGVRRRSAALADLAYPPAKRRRGGRIK
jgi:hypothetical protein